MGMTSFIELVNQRQSVRKYSSRKVEREKIEHCLEAARLAPSASNGQPWKYVVADDPELVSKLALETYGPLNTFNKFVPEAPVIIALVIEKMKNVTQIGAYLKDREFPLIDIGISAEHFCLQAAEEGLGTCMLGWFNEKQVKKLLNIPSGKRIGLLITLGYAAEGYKLRLKIRKAPEQLFSYNTYS